MVVEDLHERVGPARVIDVVSAVAAATAVQTVPMVDLTDPEHLPVSSSTRFGVRDLLTGVFSDLVFLLESDRGKAALAVYRRRLDCQTMRQLHELLGFESARDEISLITNPG